MPFFNGKWSKLFWLLSLILLQHLVLPMKSIHIARENSLKIKPKRPDHVTNDKNDMNHLYSNELIFDIGLHKSLEPQIQANGIKVKTSYNGLHKNSSYVNLLSSSSYLIKNQVEPLQNFVKIFEKTGRLIHLEKI